MTNGPLNIVGISINRPTAALEAEAGRSPQLHVLVEVENPGDKPLYVWTTRRALDYDASTKVLSLNLTEHLPDLPPGITKISTHPRTPSQVMVGAKSHATIDLAVPTAFRRAVPGKTLGLAFLEKKIGQIDRVELSIQFAGEPIEWRAQESPGDYLSRLRSHGDVVRASIVTSYKEC